MNPFGTKHTFELLDRMLGRRHERHVPRIRLQRDRTLPSGNEMDAFLKRLRA